MLYQKSIITTIATKTNPKGILVVKFPFPPALLYYT